MQGGTKIFGIGLNKTGTTTLGACLAQLGYRHLGFRRSLFKSYARGDLAAVFDAIEQFDSFDDWPYPLMFREVFARYGRQARFILTTRSSPQIWLNSLKAHTLRANPLSQSNSLAYGFDYPHGHEAEHLAFYEKHNAGVRAFFAEPGREDLLLEVCWERGDGWPQVCGFLDRPIPAAPFPHEYRGAMLAVDPGYRAINERNIAAQLNSLARRGS
jgi:hypothetical protein